VRDSFAKFSDVRVAEGLATVTVVGDGLVADPRLCATAAAAVSDLRIHLVAQPDGKRTLSFVVEATQTTLVTSRLHDCFFGRPRRRVAAQTPMVQA
jgi:aspartokinase